MTIHLCLVITVSHALSAEISFKYTSRELNRFCVQERCSKTCEPEMSISNRHIDIIYKLKQTDEIIELGNWILTTFYTLWITRHRPLMILIVFHNLQVTNLI